jgi:non-ribosomal peptide synthetase component F
VAAILAVLKAGGAYVPIDLAYPADRIQFMRRDANPVVVVTEEKVRAGLPQGSATVLDLDRDAAFLAGESTEDLSCPLHPDSALRHLHVRLDGNAERGGGSTRAT